MTVMGINVQVCIPCLAWITPGANCHILVKNPTAEPPEKLEWVSSPQQIIELIRVATVDKWPHLTDSYGDLLPLRAIAEVNGFPMCWRHALAEWHSKERRIA